MNEQTNLKLSDPQRNERSTGRRKKESVVLDHKKKEKNKKLDRAHRPSGKSYLFFQHGKKSKTDVQAMY